MGVKFSWVSWYLLWWFSTLWTFQNQPFKLGGYGFFDLYSEWNGFLTDFIGLQHENRSYVNGRLGFVHLDIKASVQYICTHNIQIKYSLDTPLYNDFYDLFIGHNTSVKAWKVSNYNCDGSLFWKKHWCEYCVLPWK